MKKIFLIFAAVCAFAACDPVSEDISNGGHITVDELKAKTTVSVDKAADGQNGNVITCSTSAPVNAKWNIGGRLVIPKCDSCRDEHEECLKHRQHSHGLKYYAPVKYSCHLNKRSKLRITWLLQKTTTRSPGSICVSPLTRIPSPARTIPPMFASTGRSRFFTR